MFVRGIRGATTIAEDTPEEIISATQELLIAICERNEIHTDDIASVILSATPDIKSAFPALAARKIGWNNVPLFCCREIAVENSLALCIRVLIHINTDKKQDGIKHVYLGKAKQLRQDLTEN